jgi:hypothetical protein
MKGKSAATPKASRNAWRNRIIGEGEEAPDQLLANPKNWRIHPMTQQAALKGVLEQIGWIQRIIVNQHTGCVLDGHLRVGLAISQGEATVPVLYVDLDEGEEALALATLDPISALAGQDNQQLRLLLEDVHANDAAVQGMLAELAYSHGKDDAVAEEEDEGDEKVIPEMELQPYESYDYVLVLCRKTQDFNNLAERLGLERVNASPVPGGKKIGMGRCVDAAKVLALMGQ